MPEKIAELPDFEVRGVVTVRDKEGNVKCELEIFSINEEDDGTIEHDQGRD